MHAAGLSLFSSLCLLAQYAEEAHAPARTSHLAWAFKSLGLCYGTMIPLTGLLLFVGAVAVVALARRPAVIAAYLVFLPLPLLIGVFGTIQGLIASFSVLAHSGSAAKPAELAEGYSTALFTALFGVLVTFPSFLVLAAGLFLRTLFAGQNRDDIKP